MSNESQQQEPQPTLPPSKSTTTLKIIDREHKYDVEDFKLRNTWNSCCLNLDSRCINFIGRFTISLSCIGFSMFQISRLNDPCDGHLPLYTSIITLVLGYWLSPNNSKEEKRI